MVQCLRLHAVTPIGFANFRHWVEGFCHKKSAVWHVNKSAKPEIQRYARIALHSGSHGVSSVWRILLVAPAFRKARTMGLPNFGPSKISLLAIEYSNPQNRCEKLESWTLMSEASSITSWKHVSIFLGVVIQ